MAWARLIGQFKYKYPPYAIYPFMCEGKDGGRTVTIQSEYLGRVVGSSHEDHASPEDISKSSCGCIFETNQRYSSTQDIFEPPSQSIFQYCM